MPDQWKGKTAIITGGAGGLGLSLARRLLSYGVKVALFDNQKEKLTEIATEGIDDCYTFNVDITDLDAVTSAVIDFGNSVDHLDILVNAAGIVGKTNIKSHEVAIADFENVMNVNVKGCLTTFKAVAPYMLKQNYGRVLHIASISGKDGNAGMLSYSTSKAAVIGMTKVQGKEYAETGITVNALAPAVVRTELLNDMPDSQVKYMTDKIPMKRCGSLEEFATMASFIISEENSFSTGFTYDLSGGRAVY